MIIPLFALANAGVEIRADALSADRPVVVGVVLGLVVGKIVGIAGAAWIATRLGLARLPDGVRWTQMVGLAAVAGTGFTVSLSSPAWPSRAPRWRPTPRSVCSLRRPSPPSSARGCWCWLPAGNRLPRARRPR